MFFAGRLALRGLAPDFHRRTLHVWYLLATYGGHVVEVPRPNGAIRGQELCVDMYHRAPPYIYIYERTGLYIQYLIPKPRYVFDACPWQSLGITKQEQ